MNRAHGGPGRPTQCGQLQRDRLQIPTLRLPADGAEGERGFPRGKSTGELIVLARISNPNHSIVSCSTHMMPIVGNTVS